MASLLEVAQAGGVPLRTEAASCALEANAEELRQTMGRSALRAVALNDRLR